MKDFTWQSLLKPLGFIMMILAIIHAFVYQFPSAGFGKPVEVLIAFGIGLYLVVASPAKIESKIDKEIDNNIK